MQEEVRYAEIYKTVENTIVELETMEPGCWVSAVAPTETEISSLQEELNIDRDFIRSALDEEETSRIESDDGQTLIVLDYPVAEKCRIRTIRSVITRCLWVS